MCSDSLHLAVREILLNDWDPIGVRLIASAQDEYDHYVEPVAKMIAAGQQEAMIASYLLEVERTSMGLEGDAARARIVAEKLENLKPPARR